jgi:hypothetical protein
MKLALLTALLSLSLCDSVCDKKVLQAELRQDLRDNNLLDCKRIVPVPHGKVESLKEKNLRVASQWESDCAFESDDHWVA